MHAECAMVWNDAPSHELSLEFMAISLLSDSVLLDVSFRQEHSHLLEG